MNHTSFRLAFLTAIFSLASLGASSQVVINEVQSANSSTVKDDLGASSDWVELFNAGNASVDLSGYYLTDDPADSIKWAIPAGTSIPSGGYLLFWADGRKSGMHTSFKLSSAGESVALFDKAGKRLDLVVFPELASDFSYGRITDGADSLCVFTSATPAAANTPTAIKGDAGTATFSLPGGFYSGEQKLTLGSSLPNAVIRYTTDGSEPTENSPVYTGPITLQKTRKETQRVGVREYSFPASFYINPKYTGERDYATVVKTKVFCDNYLPGKTSGATYFIDMRKPTLPVISLSTDGYNLFSDTAGIYVKGTRGKGEMINWQTVYANWYNGWEKAAYFEFYDEQGVQQVKKKVGISIMGDVSKNSDQKAFNVETKGKYENGKLDYKFFKDSKINSFGALSLRASGNDWKSGNMCRDAIIQSVVKGQMNLDVQEYQPAVLYINGEYFGLQNIRERLSADYCEEHFKKVDADSVDFIKLEWSGYSSSFVAKSGDTKMFDEMDMFIKNNSFAVDSNYQKLISTYIDIDAFINYYIAEIYLSNGDWPYNNLRLWRPKTAGGKFRWMLFDTDFGYGLWGRSSSENDIYTNLDDHLPRNEWMLPFTLYLRKLIQNPSFKNEFVQRFAYHINTTYHPGRLDSIATAIENLVKDERDNYSDKEWARSVSSENSVKSMIAWGTARPAAVRSQIDANAKLGNNKGWANLSVRVKDSTTGNVRLCTQKLKGSYSGLHVRNIPIRLQAKPTMGCKFVHWENAKGAVLSVQSEYSITINSDTSIIAVFLDTTTIKPIDTTIVKPIDTTIVKPIDTTVVKPIDTTVKNPVKTLDKTMEYEAVQVQAYGSHGKITIRIAKARGDVFTIEVVNVTGGIVYKNSLKVDDEFTGTIDTKYIASGIYFITIKSPTVSVVEKTIVKN